MGRISASELTRRITLQQRPLDDATGDQQAFVDVVTRYAKVLPLKGGEVVRQQRLAGDQPVAITIRRDATTREIDSSWRAYDALRPAPPAVGATVWNIKSAAWNQALDTIEILAVEEKSGASG